MIAISKTKLTVEDKRRLFFECGGLCAICCERLDFDCFSRKNIDASEYAHIIGDSEDGPRGDKTKSGLYKGDISNIILLCPTCHSKVDKNTSFYTEELLHHKKDSHIEKVRKHLDQLKNDEGYAVKYEAPIGGKIIKIDENKMNIAIASSGFICHEYPILLNPNNTAYTDDKQKYWESEKDQLLQNYSQEIEMRLKRNDVKPFLLFAMAPQPLLIQLGVLMNDTLDIRSFQKRREPDTWSWADTPCQEDFYVNTPANTSETVAVKLSLSDRITNDRVIEALGPDVSIWEISHSNPHNDFITHPSQLSKLRESYREFFRLIRERHGQKARIHVFPASPVTATIEFGRAWMPKADAELLLYDQNKSNNKFEYTFTIS